MALPDIDALWHFDRPEETEQELRTLLVVTTSPEDLAYHLELLTQIARAEGVQGHLAAAHATLDLAQSQSLEDHPRPRVRALVERGRLFQAAGQPADACAWYLRALGLARALGLPTFAVEAAHLLSQAAPPAERQRWHEAAVQMAKVAASERPHQ